MISALVILAIVLVSIVSSLLIICYSATLANAEFYDGSRLVTALDKCELSDETVEQFEDCVTAHGYLFAINDFLEMRSEICVDNLRGGQLFRVVRKYLTDNPATLNRPASLLAAMALKEAFPCH